MVNVGALIIGIGFFVIAILDGVGAQIHIRKRYRENVKIKRWQKKRAFIDILIGVGAIIIYFAKQESKVQYYVGVAVLLIGLVFLFILDNKFKKK